MKNGDIHQGTVAVESLSVETGVGRIAVPYNRLHTLERGGGRQPDMLISRQGERYYGQLVEAEVTMFRVLDATLQLSISDVAAISFASRGMRASSLRKTADAVITRFGDRFLARVLGRSLLLKRSSSIEIVDTEHVRFIDFISPDDDDKPSVQITRRDGSILQGHLTRERLQIELADAGVLDLAVDALSSLRFNSKSDDGGPDFRHHWKEPPPSLFQDPMVDGALAPEMIVVQGGEFIRGDAQGDSDERPPVSVNPGMFAIGVFEVTFDEYDRFCAATGREMPDDQGWGRGDSPVVNVSWQDATAYTEWLSRKTRKRYRLPTDAEWEFAARAGTATTYWWGDETGTARANCEGCNSLWDGAQTAPVGKFPANPLGLHDTAGNVFEWVADCYHDSFAAAPADGSALEKPVCGKRVIRGGAWSFPAKEIRSANRWRDFPARRSDDTGFRVARDVD
ncbi:MAG: formylglycine-generating enzyme family protein [Pseudomonadota bacterium]